MTWHEHGQGHEKTDNFSCFIDFECCRPIDQTREWIRCEFFKALGYTRQIESKIIESVSVMIWVKHF